MSELRKILKRTLVAVIICLAIIGILALALIRFFIIPKYNEYAVSNNRETMSVSDIAGFAKYLTNKQIFDNIKNFDKASAKEVLNIMTELEAEISDSELPVPALPKMQDTTWSETITAPKQPAVPPTPVQNLPDDLEKIEQKVPDAQKSAYERILATADKDEIAIGLAIISKIDITKVNRLQSEGRTAELKAYVKSVLTSAEISTSLKLYKKYKHLL